MDINNEWEERIKLWERYLEGLKRKVDEEIMEDIKRAEIEQLERMWDGYKE